MIFFKQALVVCTSIPLAMIWALTCFKDDLAVEGVSHWINIFCVKLPWEGEENPISITEVSPDLNHYILQSEYLHVAKN